LEPSPNNGNMYDHEKSSLDLEFFIDLLVLEWVIPQLLVKTVASGRFDDTRGEDLEKETLKFDRGYPSDGYY
jgi:hypothetical protein